MNRLLPLLLALTIAGLAVRAPAQATVAEQYLFSAINRERANRHLAPVQLDAALHRAAALHAERMAEHRDIAHQFPGEPELAARGWQAGAHFSRIAENVAEGPSILVLHDALMRSPGHRANILNAGVDAVGIAVLARNGQLYAVEDFQTTVPIMTLEQQEAAVGILLDAAGLDLLPNAEARQTCAQDAGYAEQEPPGYVLRYTTGDLSRLPSKLQARMATQREHRASVGACPSARESAFSEYTIAVMLYP